MHNPEHVWYAPLVVRKIHLQFGKRDFLVETRNFAADTAQPPLSVSKSAKWKFPFESFSLLI